MTNQELKISATYIKKLASFPDAEDRISLYLDSLFATQAQKDTFNEPENSKSKAVSSLLHFTYILGHTDASFTLDTYTHVTSDMQKNASAVVNNMMQQFLIGGNTNDKK